MKNHIAILIGALALCSCEDYLTQENPNKIESEYYFTDESSLEIYTNGFIRSFATAIKSFVDGDKNADTHSWDGQAAYFMDNYSADDATNWTTSNWSQLRSINYYLDNMRNAVASDAILDHYEGVGRFFRALFYFEKVRKYGDIPYYDFVIPSNDWASLKRPRDSRGFVMKKVMEDLDRAITDLPDNWPSDALYRLSKNAARAMKARAALYEGTFRKYHGIDLPENDWKYYLDLAAKASEEFITNSGYGLYTSGGTQTAYRDLFVSEDAQQIEVVLARDYNKGLSVFHNSTFYSLNTSYGRPGLTRKIVASYLMADGTRFTDKAGWETMEFRDECRNRDPRLAQSIRTPGYTRINSTKVEVPSLSTCMTGYQPIKFVAPADFGSDGYNLSYTDLPIIRTAEIYLNYAEAKAELGTLTQADIDLSIKKLRDRVGMPNLDMDHANANPDPYLSAPETGYPNVTGPNKGVLLEIRRERTIELLQEGHRYYDLIRWKEGKAFTQPLLGLYIPSKGEYDLDGDGTPDIYLKTKGETPSTKAPLIMEIDQDIFLSEGDHGYISPHKKNPGEWNEARDYYYPIPTDDRSLTGGALTQNPGWNDGLDF